MNRYVSLYHTISHYITIAQLRIEGLQKSKNKLRLGLGLGLGVSITQQSTSIPMELGGMGNDE